MSPVSARTIHFPWLEALKVLCKINEELTIVWMGVFLENECPDVHKEKYRASILRTTRSSHSRNKASDAIGGWYLSKASLLCNVLLGPPGGDH